ncbi:hypothetical protein CXB51_024917 [Gossypium anomalum]|uniref:Integrase catalytic domain-containing protein n=1 Tax=Gossypium anomalum TaxID=47600 RepID=A0A8J6CR05_9ROSI|nr:hypothetical protein CXB51_024917 [Gossypium anomalum]
MACDSPKQAWEKLKEEFMGSDKTRQQQLINLRRDFENLKMRESDTIKQYSDRIMAIVNNIRLLGDDFSESRVVEKVITTLPKKFESKISSLEDSRDLSAISLSELVNSLYALEQRRANRQEEHPEGAFQAKAKEGSSSSQKGEKPWVDRREKFRRDAGKNRFPPCIHCKKTLHLEKNCWHRPDVQCRSYKQLGHVERVCKNRGKAQAQQQMQAKATEDLQAQEEHVFTASYFATSSKVSSDWLVDSGCTHHMVADERLFKELNRSFASKIRIGNGNLIKAKGRGNVVINTKSGNKVISDVLFVPDIDQNLLSVGQLVEKGYSLAFENGSCIVEDSYGQELVIVVMTNRCFMLDVNQLKKKAYTSLIDDAGLWHRRFGHVNYKSLDQLHKLNLVEDMSKIEAKDMVCEVCQLDDLTRFCWVYFLKQKSEVFEAFNKFKALAENQSGYKIKALRTDNGTEYLSERFQKLCEQAGIHHQLTTVYTPQQNGVCERKNRTEKTPFKAWHGIKPSVSHLKVFGCVCYAFIPVQRRTKLERRATLGIFVGYSSINKGYRVYDPSTKKFLVSRDVRFDEGKIWSWNDSDARLTDEDQLENSLELAEEGPVDEDFNEEPVRGTRTIADIYQRCNVAIVEPSNFKEAAKNKSWKKAMEAELEIIHKNDTWDLVDRPDHKKVIGVKWVFRAKYNADGSLNKHKARLVVKGYSQQYGIDFMETFAPVARLDTIKLLFALAAQKQWRIHQLDVKSAFLNGFLKEEIFIEQPEGFKVPGEEDKVYKLKKALYGLKQAPRAWYDRVDEYLSKLEFEKSVSEPTLFIKKSENETLLIVSLYVDDLLVTESKGELIDEFKVLMQEVFEMTDLGVMTYFLGMEVNQSNQGIFISQHAFVLKILNRFCMTNYKIVSTPVTQGEKLTTTRPDIMYAVSLLSRFMHCCDVVHFKAAKRVLRYLKGTLNHGVNFEKAKELKLIGYSNSDWVGSIDNMKSTSGYFFTLGSGVFCWSSKKQQTVAQSTAKAEYIAAAAAVNQAIWLRKLLYDLNEEQVEAIEIKVDNQSAVAIAKNPVFHGKTKHFKIKYHFVREAELSKEINLVHCCSEVQLADILTKPLAVTRFEYLKKQIRVCCFVAKEEC